MPFRKECIVFPTSRCIRSAIESCEAMILPHYMTMGEFLSRASVSEGRIYPDDDLRLLALHEASDFSAFSALNIDRNFFTFIQNAQYIFRFFEELASEQVAIETLGKVDVYGEYEEHVSILTLLRNRYRAICERNGWADPIFASELFSINTDFLHNYDSVRIEVEGYLSRREIEIILSSSRIVNLEIGYTTTPYNRKMTERLGDIGFDLEENRRYVLSISKAEIIDKRNHRNNNVIECEIFHNRLAQIGFVKAKIESFVDSGIEPGKIAVILPDESIASLLRELDSESNLNLAMGTPFEDDPVFREIETIMLYLDESNVLNRARIRDIGSAKIEWLREQALKPFRMGDLESLIDMVTAEATPTESQEILREEIHSFSHLANALAEMDFKSALRIFMNRLRGRSIDDTRGGKITVMGVLETRGIDFDGVIVIDFNEGFVPHKSEKDLFLNTQTRKFASLPTSGDREGLQKHYYSMLFDRAKKVAIGCVQNTESVPSRFLLQLGIEARETQYRYERVLFRNAIIGPRVIEEVTGEYDFTIHPVSASSLKSFLTCKRQFYYRYVMHMVPHELPRDLSQERDIGNALHGALEKIYHQPVPFETSLQIREALERIWNTPEDNDPLERYMKRLWAEKLTPFFENEIRRFGTGWRVEYREKESEAIVEGISLVGRIDRIDRRGDDLEVIDYKSGKFADVDKEPAEEDTDFQLSVYAFLAESLGKVVHCGYYDLGNGTLQYEQFLEAKKERLREILRMLASRKTWIWEMCEDLARCRYCPYVYLCNREAVRGV